MLLEAVIIYIAFPDWIKYHEMVGLLSDKVRSFDENPGA